MNAINDKNKVDKYNCNENEIENKSVEEKVKYRSRLEDDQ